MAFEIPPSKVAIASAATDEQSSERKLVTGDAAKDVLKPGEPIPTSTPIAVRKCVSFGIVQIHVFGMESGDNPAAMSGGPPVRLDYLSPLGEYEVSVVEYEEALLQERRRGSELRVPPDVRARWVGPNVDLSEVRRIQHQRRHTYATADFEPWMLLFEQTYSKLKKILLKEPKGCLAHEWNQRYKKEKRAQKKMKT